MTKSNKFKPYTPRIESNEFKQEESSTTYISKYGPKTTIQNTVNLGEEGLETV